MKFVLSNFLSNTFFARMWRLKNWPLSAPSSANFYHPQLLKKIFGESWNPTAFIKKNLRSFDENWRNTSDICNRWAAAAPPPLGFLGGKLWSFLKWTWQKWLKDIQVQFSMTKIIDFFFWFFYSNNIGSGENFYYWLFLVFQFLNPFIYKKWAKF